MESSSRYYSREISPGQFNNAAGNFKCIYDHLLSNNKLNFPNYISLLDLWRLMRNTKHNNGIFYPDNQKNKSVCYKLGQL
jgi:hypothetical protein